MESGAPLALQIHPLPCPQFHQMYHLSPLTSGFHASVHGKQDLEGGCERDWGLVTTHSLPGQVAPSISQVALSRESLPSGARAGLSAQLCRH